MSGVSPLEVVANAEQITRVVRNLLDNAVGYAASTVVVTLSSNSTHAVLVIADDGPGVPVEDGHRIFERFTRLDESRSRNTGGSGLGLAIAREIIERHGGRLQVVSRPGSGAIFQIDLPLVAPEQGGEDLREEKGEATRAVITNGRTT